MHVFHIRGFSGVLMVILAVISTVLLLMLLPASFLMVLWNALIFESAIGPEISIYQGFMLWGFIVVLLKLIFNPQIKFEFQSMPNGKKGKPLTREESKKEPAETATATVVDEAADQK